MGGTGGGGVREGGCMAQFQNSVKFGQQSSIVGIRLLSLGVRIVNSFVFIGDLTAFFPPDFDWRKRRK